MYRLLERMEPWLVSIGIVAVLMVVGVLLHGLLFALARRVAERTAGKFDEFLIRRLRAPARVLIPLVLLTLSYPWLPLPGATPAFVYGVLTILFIATGAWLIIAALAADGDTTIDRVYHLDRGYANIDTKLAQMGAIISRI